MNTCLRLAISLALIVLLAVGPVAASEPSTEGMFRLYADNREAGVPNYITEDFLLLAYSMTLNETLTSLEEQVLLPKFEAFIGEALDRLSESDGKEPPVAANLNLLTVLDCLLSGQDDPDRAADAKLVKAELELIRKAEEPAKSKLTGLEMDYTQFQPRGKYTRSEQLSNYFRAMRYAGATLFPVVASQATGVTAEAADKLTLQALALAGLVMGDEEIRTLYQDLESSLTWLFGRPDDLTLADYAGLGEKLKEAKPGGLRAALLKLAKESGRQPAIISGLVKLDKLEEGKTPAEVLTGMRVMPLRFSPDAAAFQKLIHDSTGLYQGSGDNPPFSLTVIKGKPVKGLPLGLELMALLGSIEAESHLTEWGEKNYEGYDRARSKALAIVAEGSGLATEHLGLINSWLTDKRPGPGANRRLNSGLAFWTYQRYINLLYTKQSYTPAGKSLTLSDRRPTAWLEPAVELYLHLERLTELVYGLLQDEALARLSEIFGSCRKIALKIRLGGSLNESEVDFLNDLDLALKKIVGRADEPIVVDVHTDPSAGVVLQEGLGFPQVIDKSLPGSKVKARGALFSYFEFKQPLSERLTDEAWAEILADPEKISRLKLSPGSTLKQGEKRVKVKRACCRPPVKPGKKPIKPEKGKKQ